MPHTELFSTGEVAKLLGLKRHVLEYAIQSGHIPEPQMRFLNRRVFQQSEIRVIAAHFGKSDQQEKRDDEETCSSSAG